MHTLGIKKHPLGYIMRVSSSHRNISCRYNGRQVPWKTSSQSDDSPALDHLGKPIPYSNMINTTVVVFRGGYINLSCLTEVMFQHLPTLLISNPAQLYNQTVRTLTLWILNIGGNGSDGIPRTDLWRFSADLEASMPGALTGTRPEYPFAASISRCVIPQIVRTDIPVQRAQCPWRILGCNTWNFG